MQAIPMHKWKIPGLESKPNCFTAVKGLKKNQVRMFYKEKGLEDNEMKMVISVASMFKHMHTLAQTSLELKRLIKEVCEAWSVWTGFLDQQDFDELDEQTIQSVMHWTDSKKNILMCYQFRPCLSVRSNGQVFLQTVIGAVALPYDMVYNSAFCTESRALYITTILDTKWKKQLGKTGHDYEHLFEEDDTEAGKWEKMNTLAQETNTTFEFIEQDMGTYAKVFDVDNTVLKI